MLLCLSEAYYITTITCSSILVPAQGLRENCSLSSFPVEVYSKMPQGKNIILLDMFVKLAFFLFSRACKEFGTENKYVYFHILFYLQTDRAAIHSFLLTYDMVVWHKCHITSVQAQLWAQDHRLETIYFSVRQFLLLNRLQLTP